MVGWLFATSELFGLPRYCRTLHRIACMHCKLGTRTNCWSGYTWAMLLVWLLACLSGWAGLGLGLGSLREGVLWWQPYVGAQESKYVLRDGIAWPV